MLTKNGDTIRGTSFHDDVPDGSPADEAERVVSRRLGAYLVVTDANGDTETGFDGELKESGLQEEVERLVDDKLTSREPRNDVLGGEATGAGCSAKKRSREA